MEQKFIKNMKLLPTEIVNYIFSFTYNIQPRSLVLDIRNYYKSRIKVLSIYRNTYENSFDYYSLYFDSPVVMLIEDIFEYFYIVGRIHTYDKLFRVYNYAIADLNQTDLDAFNIIWGILNRRTRQRFIEFAKDI